MRAARGSGKLRSFALLLSSAMGLLACSSEEAGRGGPDTGSAGADSGADPGPFLDGFTELYCDGIAPCCSAAGYGHDPAVCKENLDLRAIPAAIDLGVPFSEDESARCLADLSGWFDSCPMTMPLSCRRVLVGSEPPGGGCFTNHQCAPPDNGPTLCIGGECGIVTFLPEGASCSGNTIDIMVGVYTYEVCEPPLYCDAQGTCRLPPAPGEPCDAAYTHSCRIDAYCNGASGPSCESRIAIGASCSSAPCTRDAYCDSGSICSPLKLAGASCANEDECFSGQCVNDACLGGNVLLGFFDSLQCIQ
jgi:hypothetical protein